MLDTAADPVSLEGLEVELLRGSVTDRSAVRAAVEGCRSVFHCAARVDLMPDRDGSIFEVNLGGTQNVVEVCERHGARLVHVSSHVALDRRPLSEPLTEANPLSLRDRCDYHRSKAHAEQYVLSRVSRADLDAVIVSPGTLTGPDDYEPSIFGKALLDLYAGRIPVLLNAVTDYADVRDVASAVVEAAERGRRGERYLLTGEVRAIGAVTRSIEAVTGRRMPRLVLPLVVGWMMLPLTERLAAARGEPPLYSAGMLRAAVSNPVVRRDKAERELGYKVRSMEGSLTDAFEFYAEQGWL